MGILFMVGYCTYRTRRLSPHVTYGGWLKSTSIAEYLRVYTAHTATSQTYKPGTRILTKQVMVGYLPIDAILFSNDY